MPRNNKGGGIALKGVEVWGDALRKKSGNKSAAESISTSPEKGETNVGGQILFGGREILHRKRVKGGANKSPEGRRRKQTEEKGAKKKTHTKETWRV